MRIRAPQEIKKKKKKKKQKQKKSKSFTNCQSIVAYPLSDSVLLYA
jgi:hypothetical protein